MGGSVKKYLCIIFIVASMLVSGCTVITPGHVGIVVNNFGSDKGVSSYTAQTGVVFYNVFSTRIFNYPTFVQTAVWTSSPHEGHPLNEEITFNTKEGTSVSGDISLSYQLVKDSVPYFYVKFRSDDLDNFTHGFLRNIARDAFNETASSYTLEDVYGLKKEELLKAIKTKINSQVNQYGVTLIQLGFTGALRMDPGILTALNNKLKAIQDAIAVENKSRQFRADSVNVIIAAQGQANANEILSKSITPSLVQWKSLDIQRETIAKWDAHLPMVQSGNGGGIFVQIPLQK
jgi:regulator of protease activity HflC (stomatin/prohibitin superfamily)